MSPEWKILIACSLFIVAGVGVSVDTTLLRSMYEIEVRAQWAKYDWPDDGVFSLWSGGFSINDAMVVMPVHTCVDRIGPDAVVWAPRDDTWPPTDRQCFMSDRPR